MQDLVNFIEGYFVIFLFSKKILDSKYDKSCKIKKSIN